MRGREDSMLLTKLSSSPLYEPNYEFVKQRLNKGFFTLEKQENRKPLHKKSIAIHETIFDPSEFSSKSMISPK